MQITTLRDLFEHQIQDLYSAEKQIIQALPTMIEAATDEKLKKALTEHLEVTKEQKNRLETIAEQCVLDVVGPECLGMKGVLAEGKKTVQEVADPTTKDAAIIVSAQRVEHYEIAGYGGAVEFANVLDLSDAAGLLSQTLDEEKDADSSLTGLAEGGLFKTGINEEAAEA